MQSGQDHKNLGQEERRGVKCTQASLDGPCVNTIWQGCNWNNQIAYCLGGRWCCIVTNDVLYPTSHWLSKLVANLIMTLLHYMIHPAKYCAICTLRLQTQLNNWNFIEPKISTSFKIFFPTVGAVWATKWCFLKSLGMVKAFLKG